MTTRGKTGALLRGGLARFQAAVSWRGLVALVASVAAVLVVSSLIPGVPEQVADDPGKAISAVLVVVLGLYLVVMAIGRLVRRIVRRLSGGRWGQAKPRPIDTPLNVDPDLHDSTNGIEVPLRFDPDLEDSTNAIELDATERRLFCCWRDEREPEAGVLLATDRRVILAQSSGIFEVPTPHGRPDLAFRTPGKILRSIDYSQIKVVTGWYLSPLSSLARIGSIVMSGVDYEKPGPMPRVRITVSDSDMLEVAIRPLYARKLLFVLASQTRLAVPRFWLDRLPLARSRRTTHPSFWVEPTLQEEISRIGLDAVERRLLSCRRKQHNPEEGVLVATDRRLILAQSSGVFKVEKRRLFRSPILASHVPGKILRSIDYSQITKVTGRYLGPLSSILRRLDIIFGFFHETDPPHPVPRVRIQARESDGIELATSPGDTRKLLFLLSTQTHVKVPYYWVDRLPWSPLKRSGTAGRPRGASPTVKGRSMATGLRPGHEQVVTGDGASGETAHETAGPRQRPREAPARLGRGAAEQHAEAAQPSRSTGRGKPESASK
jgi:hypothetical protein